MPLGYPWCWNAGDRSPPEGGRFTQPPDGILRSTWQEGEAMAANRRRFPPAGARRHLSVFERHQRPRRAVAGSAVVLLPIRPARCATARTACCDSPPRTFLREMVVHNGAPRCRQKSKRCNHAPWNNRAWLSGRLAAAVPRRFPAADAAVRRGTCGIGGERPHGKCDYGDRAGAGDVDVHRAPGAVLQPS